MLMLPHVGAIQGNLNDTPGHIAMVKNGFSNLLDRNVTRTIIITGQSLGMYNEPCWQTGTDPVVELRSFDRIHGHSDSQHYDCNQKPIPYAPLPPMIESVLISTAQLLSA